ncbi:MarR family transcriptional regulator [Natronobacterium texcoconense]|nr:MarR family transcriptional regulator [Natronobacterium texcoconense]
MQTQKHRSAKAVASVPESLESAQAKLVYIYLEAADGATIDDLGEALAMKKIDILSVLNSLSSRDFVAKRGEEYVVA